MSIIWTFRCGVDGDLAARGVGRRKMIDGATADLDVAPPIDIAQDAPRDIREIFQVDGVIERDQMRGRADFPQGRQYIMHRAAGFVDAGDDDLIAPDQKVLANHVRNLFRGE